MSSELFLFSVLVVISALQSLKSVKTWQRKEYRFDKFLDFFGTHESVSFIFDIPFFGLFCILLLSIVNQSTSAYFLLVQYAQILIIFAVTAWLVILLFTKKLHPVITAKSVLGTVLTFVLLCVCSWLFVTVSPWFLLAIIMPWAVSFLAFVMLHPVDYLAKSRVWKAALQRRTKELSKLQVIAVSGSYGKTTVKDILHTLFVAQYSTQKTKEFQNTTLSVAKRILAIPANTHTFIAEIGAYRVGDGVDMCKFILPSAAIITGLNEQHFSLFGSVENIITAESESLRFLQPGQYAVINWNSALCRKIVIPDGVKLIRYGLYDADHGSFLLDYAASEIYFDGQYTHFTLDILGSKTRLKTNAVSRGNIQNIVGAIALAHTHGIGLSVIAPLLTSIQMPHKTLEIQQKTWGTLIDDSHNANIDGVLNALTLLFDTKKPHIVVLDEIMELGTLSEEIHKKVAQKIFDVRPVKVVLLGKSYPHIVQKELIRLGFDEAKIMISGDGQNGAEILDWLELNKYLGCLLLAEGFRARYVVDVL